jgi:hypothetical protein
MGAVATTPRHPSRADPTKSGRQSRGSTPCFSAQDQKRGSTASGARVSMLADAPMLVRVAMAAAARARDARRASASASIARDDNILVTF